MEGGDVLNLDEDLPQSRQLDNATRLEPPRKRFRPSHALEERAQDSHLSDDNLGATLRPMSTVEMPRCLANDAPSTCEQGEISTPEQAIVTRRLKLAHVRQRLQSALPRLDATPGVEDLGDPIVASSHSVPSSSSSLAQASPTLRALEQIRGTPYECSLLSRLHGSEATRSGPIFAVDWETISPWMDLMGDVRAHHELLHAEREQLSGTTAPIVYTCLQECHLDQVHDLLHRVFWAGINVRDSLDFSPERCTVVAMYKRLVIGLAILSSPQETYITYLAVKAGWEGTKIATTMLYHLIKMNPNKDISLHVSANNPAMLLYNRFGFKAEEFVVGFYEDYLDPLSHASNNAFRLRLRQNNRA